jgi:hypothetical protein
MGRIISLAVKNFREMDRFSVAVIYHGLQLTCGLYAMAVLFSLLAYERLSAGSGRYFQALVCYHAAVDTAPAVLIATLAAAFICDIIIKDYRPGGSD